MEMKFIKEKYTENLLEELLQGFLNKTSFKKLVDLNAHAR